jgi:hypothetical protein
VVYLSIVWPFGRCLFVELLGLLAPAFLVE